MKKIPVRHISEPALSGSFSIRDIQALLAGEDYDAQGKLWKTKEGYPIPVWELGGACDVEPFAQYNLTSGRYVSDQSVIGTGADIRYFEQSNDPHFSSGFYSAENLRAISER